MLSTLLVTKLHRPHPLPSPVARPRRAQRPDEGLSHGHLLTLVIAPAGYGKTTPVSQWLGKIAIPSAWLMPDQGDNEPARSFARVVAAVQS